MPKYVTIDGVTTDTIMLRLPVPLLNWIAAKSDETFRSRNKLAQMILQQAMDADILERPLLEEAAAQRA